jgi:ubiquitin-conjugating enzyme E2 S
MSAAQENIAPQTVRRLSKEVGKLVSAPPEDIKLHINEEDITDIQATITGPQGTPYAGGQFRLKIVLGESFPANPPKGFFITKIFHPNVAKNGSICVNTLKRDWKPTYGIEHILTVIKCLLIYPNPASALNEEAGKLLLEQYEDFAKRAKMMTEIHAKPKEAAGAEKTLSKYMLEGNAPIASKKMKDKSGDGKKALKAQNKKKNLKRL